jgi:hypothetical protein
VILGMLDFNGQPLEVADMVRLEAFAFGRARGAVEGVLAACGVPAGITPPHGNVP